MNRVESEAFLRETLLAVLPPGVPPSFLNVTSVKATGNGRNQRIVGNLLMFDGQPATVECWQAGMCRAHTFTELLGGDVSFEDGRWVRVDPVTHLPISIRERAE